MLEYIKNYLKSENAKAEEYKQLNEEIASIDEKIKKKEAQIERLKKKKTKLYGSLYEAKYPDWIDIIIEPLMKELEQKTGLQGKIYGPEGPRGEATICLLKDRRARLTEQTCLSITLLPPSKDGKVLYDTEDVFEFEDNETIGSINDRKIETAMLPDTAEQILNLLYFLKFKNLSQVHLILKDGDEVEGSIDRITDTYVTIDETTAFGDMRIIQYEEIAELMPCESLS